MNKDKIKFKSTLFTFILVLIITVILSLCLGRYFINPIDVIKILLSKIIPLETTWNEMSETVVLGLRLPRVVAAIIVGGALALSGATYQGVFKNPLVSPDLLGVSTGACIGASIAILLGFNSFALQLSAFIFGTMAVLLTSTIPKIIKNNSMMMLVLSGVIVSGLASSIMGIIKFVADTETQLPAITFWQMGSIAKVNFNDVLLVLPAILIASTILILLSWRINILSLGDFEAKSLGVNVKATRRLTIICSTILTAATVCISGTVGWVGLVIPHLARIIIGYDNTKLLPIAIVLGSIFMLIIDTLSRSITSAELPLTILTGLIGAPFYFFLLTKQRMKL